MGNTGDAARISRFDMLFRHLVRKCLRAFGKISIRERENDFVISCLAALRRNKNRDRLRVLDLGSSSSLLPLRLALRGFEMVAVDVRLYPFKHKNLITLQADITHPQFGNHQSPFDAVTCISTLEHVGLGYYEDHLVNNGDKISLKNIYKVLKPSGSLIITMPYAGHFSQDNFQRIYDEKSIDELFSDYWQLQASQYYMPIGKKSWAPTTKAEAAKIYPTYPISNNACFWFTKI